LRWYALRERGCHLGILTRNAMNLALLTLRAIGWMTALPSPMSSAVMKRHNLTGGLLHFAKAWRVAPGLVMVGDYRFDLECARAAGARSVVNRRKTGRS
jgi:phosphoglycolate phosphatase-like HAD superfamily hydrolase